MQSGNSHAPLCCASVGARPQCEPYCYQFLGGAHGIFKRTNYVYLFITLGKRKSTGQQTNLTKKHTR
jgi:hypothetical protein